MCKKCLKCERNFDVYVIISGRKRDLRGRKFCLQCSPFGRKNNKDLRFDSVDFAKSFEERRKESRTRKSKKWQKKIRRSRKQKLITLLGGKCKICGYCKCIAALHFHHKNGSEKSFGIGAKGLTGDWKKLVSEVKKCDLLCANCHAETHYQN